MSLVEIYTPPRGSYFLTQTLKPAYYKLNAQRQIKETRTLFKNLLKRYSDQWQFAIELTKSANIHYHASLILRDDSTITRLCLLDDLKILGNTKLDTIKPGTEENIRNYIQKDIHITDRIINYTKKGSLRSKNKIKIISNSTMGKMCDMSRFCPFPQDMARLFVETECLDTIIDRYDNSEDELIVFRRPKLKPDPINNTIS